ncbi:MAG TPA: GntR family transcriptional regulator [Actinoplanes sp.]|nr:GntR family transcriptional regulator [Actinoplanes sp.]
MITVEDGSAVPPYEQIRAQFARRIVSRALPAGTRLPTVRRLAADLGLAINTVGRAYRELETAGLVETRGRAGTFVTAAGDHSREHAQTAAAHYAATAAGLGLDAAEALRIVRAAITARSAAEQPDRMPG